MPRAYITQLPILGLPIRPVYGDDRVMFRGIVWIVVGEQMADFGAEKVICDCKIFQSFSTLFPPEASKYVLDSHRKL